MGLKFNQISLTDIPKSISDKLYEIHFHTYQRKNTGLNKDNWKYNLNIDYHSLSKKQLFTYNHLGIDSLIDGYLITAGTQMSDNTLWVKILEGAAYTQGSYINSISAFNQMLLQFITYANEKKWNLWGEVSISHSSIFQLMINLGFSPMAKIELADSLYTTFLGKKAKFELLKVDNNLLTFRNTQLFPNYSGFLIDFEHFKNINSIKHKQLYEYNR